MNPLVIGVVVMVLLVGGGAAVAYFNSRRNNVDSRLEDIVGQNTLFDHTEETKKPAGPSVRDRFDKVLSNRLKTSGAIRERLARADIKLRVSEYIAVVGLSAVGTGIAAWFMFHQNTPLAIVGVFVGLRLPKMWSNMKAKRRQSAFNHQLGDTLNLWVNALRSGYSVLQGMEAIATELPPPIATEFERVVQEVRLGLSVDQALNNMLKRVPSEDLDLVVTAVNIQREVGGNLAEILDIISFTIRERVRIKGEIQTLTSQGRLSGWVISLLPIILGLILFAINPEYMEQLWIKERPWLWPDVFPCGWCVISAMIVLIVAGAVAIQKIVDIEV